MGSDVKCHPELNTNYKNEIEMVIKKELKRIKFTLVTFRLYVYDYIRYLKSTNFGKLDKYESLTFKLRKDYHKIEKGLTMTPRRKFFGERVLDNIVSHIQRINNTEHPEVIRAIQVIRKYLVEHNYDDRLERFIKFERQFDMVFDNSRVGFYKQTGENYLYSECNINMFDKIISERRTTRHFRDATIAHNDYEKIFNFAKFSPSACNRQSWSVNVVTNRETIKAILELQNGNAGFGDDLRNIIVISGDLSSCVSPEERKQIWFDSGLFTMNLINLMHAHGIGSCCLNWCVDSKKDKKINDILSMSSNHAVTLILAAGYYKDEFLVCDSPKKSPADFVKYIV